MGTLTARQCLLAASIEIGVKDLPRQDRTSSHPWKVLLSQLYMTTVCQRDNLFVILRLGAGSLRLTKQLLCYLCNINMVESKGGLGTYYIW